MMLLSRVVAVCAVVGLGACATPTDGALASNAAAVEQIRLAEAELAAALAGSDTEKLGKLWSEDFVSTMADGHVVLRDQRLKAISQEAAKTSVESHNDEVLVRIYGDTALAFVKSIWLVDGKRVGEPYQATHVWVRQFSHWRLTAAHISAISSAVPKQ